MKSLKILLFIILSTTVLFTFGCSPDVLESPADSFYSEPDIQPTSSMPDITENVSETSAVSREEELVKDTSDYQDLKTDTAPGVLTSVSSEISVHFIDVGQGDAILIKSEESAILIDGGDRGTVVVDYLRANSVNSLDLIISSHPHSDHVGGLINVMQSIPVKEVLDPGVVHTTKTFEDYLTVIDEKNIKFTEGRVGQKFTLPGGVVLDILHPQSPSSAHVECVALIELK